MTRNTLKFFFWIVIVYIAILFVARGITSDSTPMVSLTAIPLIIIAVIIIRDLVGKSTPSGNTLSRRKTSENITSVVESENPVTFLGRQLKVTAQSSKSYFDDVVRSRLREILVLKASLQTGIEPTELRGILKDPVQGIGFLHDQELYHLLYTPIPIDNMDRIHMVRQIVTLIEDWKP